MVTVYGADWCEDTDRSRRYLRRLGVRHRYLNVDADLEALAEARALNNGKRRTPTIEIDGEVLVEPLNAALAYALIRLAEITDEEVRDRMALQNVGDLERALRVGAGLLTFTMSRRIGGAGRWMLGAVAAIEVLTGITGWCPLYRLAAVSSLGGPGDRPHETERSTWLMASGA